MPYILFKTIFLRSYDNIAETKVAVNSLNNKQIKLSLIEITCKTIFNFFF